jgi:phosphatidylserine decarboxylase
MPLRQPPVEDLIRLLQSSNYLRDAVTASLETAQVEGIDSLESFYNFLDSILTHIPTEKNLMPTVRQFYFVLSKSPGDLLRKDKSFNDWINEFVKSRGDFLDTTASAETLDTFINNPEYKIEDYIKGPSGWLTYNQFLGRRLKPGKRPVAGLGDDNIIVSPVDGMYMGQWPVADDSTIQVKGVDYSIKDLINGSAYAERFKEGIFTHTFLAITDYHWYHVPVTSVIKEVRKIPGNTWVNAEKKPDGSLENIDDVGFQFTHTRGCIVIESAVGLVAVMPVGMGHISSVTLDVEEGTELVKGEAFGYFAFGGSDIIMLFEKDKVAITASEKKQYKQGEQIAIAKK